MDGIGVVDDARRDLRASKEYRLGMPFESRMVTTAFLSGGAGMVLGLSHGANTSGLRFRAENAHRLPRSQQGWYRYHQAKNYAAILGSMREGVRMGFRVSSWTLFFFGLETVVDESRMERDAMSSIVAGLSVASAFSFWNRFPLSTAVRTAKIGLLFGVVYGVTQDGLASLRGQRVSYVDWLMKTTQQWKRSGVADQT